MPRPSIITEALTMEFCSLVEKGASVPAAIRKTKIARASYYRWESNVRHDRGTRLECRFINAVNLTLGREKLRRERLLLKTVDDDWKRLAWWLERRFPDEYRRRRQHPLPDYTDTLLSRSTFSDGSCADEASPPIPDRVVWDSPQLAGANNAEPVVGKPNRGSHQGRARDVNYRKIGTPKLTNRLRGLVCFYVRASGSTETAMMMTGINLGRYERMTREVSRGGGTRPERLFVLAVEQSEGEVKMMIEEKLMKNGDKNWRSIAWWLARKYSYEYAKRSPLPLPLPDPYDPDPIAIDDRIVWTESPHARPVESLDGSAP